MGKRVEAFETPRIVGTRGEDMGIEGFCGNRYLGQKYLRT